MSVPSGGKSLLEDQRGMALLITIMTMSVLIAVTVMFYKKSWHNYLVANNYKTTTQLKAIADSGINIGLKILQQGGESKKYDTLLDGWSTLSKKNLTPLFVNGKLVLKIVDLSGRLQINSIVDKTGKKSGAKGTKVGDGIKGVLFRLLLSGGFGIKEKSEARNIVDALVDWIDADDRESDNGAESNYYQTLKNPYGCRNGPVQYIEELLLVKGITPALLFGEGGKKGLADYLTVYGKDGKININTADTLLIKSLDSSITDELIEKLNSFRTDEENKGRLASPTWYLNTGFWPGDITLNAKFLTTQSTYFIIKATGTYDSLYFRESGVAQRTDRKHVELLSKMVE